MKRFSVLLAIVGFVFTTADAATTVKSSKSNSSDKIATCPDLKCCEANPSAVTENGQSCSAIFNKNKNSGHASEKKGRGLGIAAHKEGQPATPTITPTPKPVAGALTFGRDQLKGTTRAGVTPTPAPKAKK